MAIQIRNGTVYDPKKGIEGGKKDISVPMARSWTK
jgi:formylmethanofuran dehydrogenase subunit A